MAITTPREGIGDAPVDPFQSYAPLPGIYDEFREAGGSVRPHWRLFADSFAASTPDNHAARAARLTGLVRENGIADDIFAEHEGGVDPWRIDLMPILFAPAEWRWLQQALTQRARLFDAVLRDIYGAQKLLRDGVIPPYVVLGDPAYLRPAREATPDGAYLDFYAADLARGPDGRWRVLDNHAETPAGSGFALANRVVHSQIATDWLRAANALRLAAFYQKMQAELLGRANRDDPLIALLTPGPHHEDYFGHAYLARYLGLVLMEGGDLRVSGGRVFMKTLEGLKPVDLILRCVEGASADPLELDPSGFLGPAGLMQAVRKDRGLTTNMIGSAVVENRGIGAHLPAVARALFGEELMLPDAPRIWLGDAQARAHALDRLDHYIVRRAREGTGRPGRAEIGRFAPRLSGDEREALRRDILLNGAGLVAEEPIGFATSPSWSPAGLRPAPYAMRLFVARFGEEYHVMPGGLALTVNAETGVSLAAAEGHARDVWMISDTEVSPHVSLLRPPVEATASLRGGKGLRSRIADNLFWLGRYVERADAMLRVMRVALTRVREDGSMPPGNAAVRKALEAAIAKGDPPPKSSRDEPARAIEQLVRALMTDLALPYGLPRTLESAHRVASLLRDRLSAEAWRTLQTFDIDPVWRGESLFSSAGDMLDALDKGLLALAAFNGMIAENMTRNYGWRFLEIGRRLERAGALSELLLAQFGEVQDEESEATAMLFALEAADSIITFRSRHLFAPALSRVLDLLLIDETNPRSVAFQLAAIDGHLRLLPQGSESGAQTEEQRMSLDLLTRVRLAQAAQLATAGPDRARREFRALFSHLATELPRLSETITRRYFNLTQDELRRVGSGGWPRP